MSVDLTERRAGWPAKALWGAWSEVFDIRVGSTTTQFHAARVIPGESFYDYGANYVPLLPLWPGFLIDTLFYAATWFAILFGFTSAKRAIRRKRGRCVNCGYDLRGLPPGRACPECGWGREDDVISPRRGDGM